MRGDSKAKPCESVQLARSFAAASAAAGERIHHALAMLQEFEAATHED